jgi:hypothetical protein
MWPPEKLYGKNFHPRRGHMTSMNAGSKQKWSMIFCGCIRLLLGIALYLQINSYFKMRLEDNMHLTVAAV